MKLFNSDLYRNFGIGFALGAVVAGWQIAPQFGEALVSPAQAATVAAPAPGVAQ